MSRGRNAYRRAGWWTSGTGWTTGADAPVDGRDNAGPAPAADVDELRHGYRLGDLDRIARGATLGTLPIPSLYGERYAIAWSAAAEALYAAESPPSPTALRTAAIAAITDDVDGWTHHHGCYRNGRASRGGQGAGTSPAFRRYWLDWIRPATSDPSDAIAERLAVWQVLDLVTASQRAAIMALAATGDYAAAAQALGIAEQTLRATLCRARAVIGRAWHAPCAPPKRWADRRVRSRTETGTTRTPIRKVLTARRRYRTT